MELNRVILSVLFLTAGVILTSCIEVNGSGYSDLSESEKRHVKKCEAPLDSIKNDGNLYKVTVRQVKDYVNRYKNVIVYEYLPFCSGDNGISPTKIKRTCDKRKIHLVVISSVYDGIFPIPLDNTFQLFVIDNSVYHTDNYQTYGEQFYKSLTGSDSEDRKTNSFHYFCNGKYVCSYDSI
mgnify:CR=1 FL=1